MLQKIFRAVLSGVLALGVCMPVLPTGFLAWADESAGDGGTVAAETNSDSGATATENSGVITYLDEDTAIASFLGAEGLSTLSADSNDENPLGMTEITSSSHDLWSGMYFVKQNTTIDSGYNGLIIHGNVLIYIPQGVTLTVYGNRTGDDSRNGGGAAILLESGNTLTVTGAGTLYVRGGNAGDGGNGGSGTNAYVIDEKDRFFSGDGGNGGNGGGGAGAGIGTNGGQGGQGGWGGSGRRDEGQHASLVNGSSGTGGGDGSIANLAGSLYVAGSLTLNLGSGSAGSNGNGGSGGSCVERYIWYTITYQRAGGGGGGAGGCGGSDGYGYGAGGAGGQGGGGGGGGGTCIGYDNHDYPFSLGGGGKSGTDSKGAAVGRDGANGQSVSGSVDNKIGASGGEAGRNGRYQSLQNINVLQGSDPAQYGTPSINHSGISNTSDVSSFPVTAKLTISYDSTNWDITIVPGGTKMTSLISQLQERLITTGRHPEVLKTGDGTEVYDLYKSQVFSSGIWQNQAYVSKLDLTDPECRYVCGTDQTLYTSTSVNTYTVYYDCNESFFSYKGLSGPKWVNMSTGEESTGVKSGGEVSYGSTKNTWASWTLDPKQPLYPVEGQDYYLSPSGTGGYYLSGWEDRDANKTYALGEQFSNLREKNGDTVTLYAIWTRCGDDQLGTQTSSITGDVSSLEYKKYSGVTVTATVNPSWSTYNAGSKSYSYSKFIEWIKGNNATVTATWYVREGETGEWVVLEEVKPSKYSVDNLVDTVKDIDVTSSAYAAGDYVDKVGYTSVLNVNNNIKAGVTNYLKCQFMFSFTDEKGNTVTKTIETDTKKLHVNKQVIDLTNTDLSVETDVTYDPVNPKTVQAVFDPALDRDLLASNIWYENEEGEEQQLAPSAIGEYDVHGKVTVIDPDNYTLKVPDETAVDNGTSLSEYAYTKHISIHAAKSGIVTPGSNTTNETTSGVDTSATSTTSTTAASTTTTASTTSAAAASSSSSTAQTGDILGVVGGACLAVVAVAIGALFWIRRRKGKDQ